MLNILYFICKINGILEKLLFYDKLLLRNYLIEKYLVIKGQKSPKF